MLRKNIKILVYEISYLMRFNNTYICTCIEYDALLISGYMLFYLSIILQEAKFPLLLKWNIWYVIIF